MDQQRSNVATGGQLTCSTLSLMVPTLRLMSAFAWQVVQHCNVVHYGKVEELVQLVTEVVPSLLSDTEKVHLLLGLRATEEFPEADLLALVWEFISRLDKLLPLPDIKQTAELLNADPFLLEECGQLEFEPDQLKTLLHHHTQQRNAKERSWVQSQGTIPSTASSPQSKPQQNRKRCRRTGRKLSQHRTEEDKDGHSDHSHEEEEGAEGKQSDEEWLPEDCSKVIVQSDEESLPVNNHSLEEEEGAEGKQSDEEWLPEDGSKTKRKKNIHVNKDLKEEQSIISSSVRRSGIDLYTRPGLHACSQCSFSHSQEDTVLQHIRQEHTAKHDHLPHSDMKRNKRPIHRCSYCGLEFTQLHLLTGHIGIHTLPFHCDHCDKRYARKKSLITHRRLHTGERPFTCSHCGRGFVQKAHMQEHVRTHTGERRYKCHICGKTSNQHLTRHMRMHKGEKNYLCTECGKAFLTSGELRKHTRSHTGERPYTCKQCGKGFIASCLLTVHMRSHTGEKPYSCTHCSKAFFTRKDLKRHTFIHSDKKPFECSKCGKGFTQRWNQKVHMRTCKKDIK